MGNMRKTFTLQEFCQKNIDDTKKILEKYSISNKDEERIESSIKEAYNILFIYLEKLKVLEDYMEAKALYDSFHGVNN